MPTKKQQEKIDTDIAVGDIVTCYMDGYFRVLEVYADAATALANGGYYRVVCVMYKDGDLKTDKHDYTTYNAKKVSDNSIYEMIVAFERKVANLRKLMRGKK